MARLIDADALLKKQTTIRVTYHCQGADEWDDYEVVLVKDINNAPTITPDEVRGVVCGTWLDHQEGRWVYAKCSRCETVHDVKYNYCPSCGAKMEVSEDA